MYRPTDEAHPFAACAIGQAAYNLREDDWDENQLWNFAELLGSKFGDTLKSKEKFGRNSIVYMNDSLKWNLEEIADALDVSSYNEAHNANPTG